MLDLSEPPISPVDQQGVVFENQCSSSTKTHAPAVCTQENKNVNGKLKVVLEEEEESFLLVYICLFGFFLYFLWLRRDRTNVGSKYFYEINITYPMSRTSIGGYPQLGSQGHLLHC